MLLPFRLTRALPAVLALALVAPPAGHAQGVRIAAVVNDQVITTGDFDARMKLVLNSSNIPEDPQLRSRIAAQVMRQMIDEKLEMQQAKEDKVKVSAADVEHQLDLMAHQSNMTMAALDKFLADHQIDKQTLVDKITAELTWAKEIEYRFGDVVNVSEDEVDEAYKQILKERQQPAYHIEEIFLAVQNPEQDDEVHALADKLFDQIRQDPRQFPELAREFSQSTGAFGGDLGWMVPSMLDPDVAKVITEMQPGTMTRPMRLAGGYHIYLLADRRDPPSAGENVTVDLTQVVFPLAADADAATREATVKKAEAATADARSCGEMAKLGQSVSPQLSGPIGNVQIGELPEEIRPMILAAPVARPTRAVPVRGGIGVFMVCQRSGGAPAITREEVENSLRNQRMENAARGFLEDLHRVAYVDLRV